MNKNEAKKLQAGDKVLCEYDRKVYTVQSLILSSPNKYDKAPLVVTTDGTVITHRLLKEVTP